MLDLNPKYKPLFVGDNRYYVVTGGRGSGKSFGVSVMVLLSTFEKGNNVLYTRYTMTSASTSIVPEMVDKINMLGLEQFFTVNQREIINNSTGNTIYFRGLKTGSGNQTAALKSLSNIATFVLDEAEEMVDEALFDKVDLSIRTKETQNRVIMVLNPATRAHWIYNRFFESKGLQGGENTVVDDTAYIHTSYLDNVENLDESFLKSIERIKETDPKKYQHVVLGGWADVAEGVIFKNWEIGDFSWAGDYTGVGLDFGFANDPTAATLITINKKAKTIHLKELFYAPELTTSEIAESLLKRLKTPNKLQIIADNAEPRLIHELKHNHNFKIEPCVKGVNSIMNGIGLMLDYKLIVDPSSKNLMKELNNYRYKDGTDKPVDDFNHALDSIRYYVTHILDRPNKGNYFLG
jgi:phage terminase large subunit